jgi:nascent polypeptide-associated complex subunit alpha
MFPGIDPRQMKQMMKKMGMQQIDLDAKEVIIRLSDKELVFQNPSVSIVKMMGQETYQLTGEVIERSLDTKPDINEEDVKTVMEQTNSTEEEARKAIEESNGDLAEAIMKLSEN